jgi:muconate cycloisomerase
MAPRIERIEVFPLKLPFKAAFSISRGSVGSPETGAPHVYVRVTSSDGVEGWGEARPSPRWSYETLESVVTTLRGYLAPAVQGLSLFDLDGAHARMHSDIAPGVTLGQPIAKSALDMALHDLAGRTLDVSLPQLWGIQRRDAIELSYLVSASTAEEAHHAVTAARELGYRGVKVKIGLYPHLDPAILRAAKEAAGGLFIWADANQAYAPAEALTLARTCERLGIDVLEQPIAANNLSGLRRLAAAADIPIALDESIAAGRVHHGDNLLLCGFGAGLAWGTAILKW